MKEYIVFKEAYDIFMADVASKEKDENVALMDDSGNISFYTNVVLGSFVEPIQFSQGYRSNLRIERDVRVLEGGGFFTKKLVYHENDDTPSDQSYQVRNIIMLDNDSNKSAFLQFEDDDSARLWVETMRSEYNERGGY